MLEIKKTSQFLAGYVYGLTSPLMPMMIIMGMISFTITPAQHTATDSNDKDD